MTIPIIAYLAPHGDIQLSLKVLQFTLERVPLLLDLAPGLAQRIKLVVQFIDSFIGSVTLRMIGFIGPVILKLNEFIGLVQ